MKRQPKEWEKILAKYMTDTGLISKICKYFIQLNIKKKGRRSEQTFFQRSHTNDQQAHEKMLEISDQRNANQNHIEISPHNCQNGIHQKKKKKKVDQDMDKRETFYTVGGNEIGVPLLKIVRSFSIN